MLSLQLEATEIAELEDYYSSLNSRSLDLKPIQRDLDDIQREELNLRFQSSPGTEVGGTVYGDVYWDRLSNWYLNQVPRRRGGQIMIDTGRLRTDATSPGSGNSSNFNGAEYEFSINTPYATKQNTMRQLLFWSEGLLKQTEEAILNYVITGRGRS